VRRVQAPSAGGGGLQSRGVAAGLGQISRAMLVMNRERLRSAALQRGRVLRPAVRRVEHAQPGRGGVIVPAGAPQHRRQTREGLLSNLPDQPTLQEFDVYNGAIQPGSHTLSVALTYQGNGFGVFSYLKGYKFNVKSSHTFVAGESKSTNITVVGYEKGNITTQLSDKPAIDFRVNVMSAGEGGAAATATKK